MIQISTCRTCLVTILIAAALSAVQERTGSQQAQNAPLSSGTYKVSGANKLNGTEEFKITQTADRATIETSGELNEAHSSRSTRTRLELEKGRLSRYWASATTGPAQRNYTIDFWADSARVKIEAGPDKSDRTLQVPSDAILLDNDVWAQYKLLLARYDMAKKGVQNFTIFVPGGGLRVYNAQVEFEGAVLYDLHGRKVAASNFVVMLADAYEVDIVADQTGLPLRVERYFDNKKAVLQ